MPKMIHGLVPHLPLHDCSTSCARAFLLVKHMIDADLAQFRHDSDTGFIIRIESDGTEAVACYDSYETKKGYLRRQIQWGKTTVNASCVAWLLCCGHWPTGEVDHIDGDSTNNRIDNLRCVTHAENNKNKRLYKTSKTGISGVTKLESGRYRVRIGVNGKQLTCGTYATKNEAENAAKAKYQSLGFHANHGR